MKFFFSLLLLPIMLFIFMPAASAQLRPEIRKAVYFDKTPALKDMERFEPGPRDRSWKDGVIRNEESGREFNDNPHPLPEGLDPVLQSSFGFRSSSDIIANFEGVGNRNSVYPPDTDGDVGPDHYFQMINLSFEIYDKEGNSLFGPYDNRTLWSGFVGPWTGTNDGDPVILYDEQADRWVATQFAIHTSDGTYWELVALSETGDPLGSWYRYAFQFPAFNDYPKMGVWPDGYYFSFNMFGSYRRAAVCALDRDAMLAGDSTARMILFDMPEGSEPWSLLPADFDGPMPPAGTPNYFAYTMDDAFGSGDYLSIWSFAADWQNPENSTFHEITRLNTAPFNSWFCNGSLGACLPQPDGGPALEVLSDRLMYRLQYRNFGSYEAMVTNHTVNVDGNGHAGIRWYELRDNHDGNGWSIFQQGTYAPDEHHRWMGSIAMDGRGYIALGFSIVSPGKYPSIRYTGRSPNDPLGEMTFFEEEIMAGTGIQTGSAARWGDYSMMSVDPSDDTTFWFTTEYVKESGDVSWRTRIAGFRITEDHISPARVADLSAAANTTNSITLHWTSTGDNGNEGNAFLYDLRYSTEPITEENFDAAQQAAKIPAPGVPGTIETLTVYDLIFDTVYYFAVKVRDKQFNFSTLSNIAEAATPGAPDIVLQDYAIDQKIFPGSAGDRLLAIHNNGLSDLRFQLYKDTVGLNLSERKLGDYADRLRKPDPAVENEILRLLSVTEDDNVRGGGEVRGIYTGAAKSISGIAWVGEQMYMLDMEKGYLIRYDTALQACIDTMTIHASPFSMAWDGEFLWIGNKVGNFFAYNTDGSPTGYSFSSPNPSFSTIAWDGSRFLTNYIMERNPVIWQTDETGQVTGSIKALISNMNIWQLAYAPEHYNGHIWFTNNYGKIGQLMVDEENAATPVQVFQAPSSTSYTLSHDGTDLWYGKIGGTLYRIDDGIEELNWIKFNPREGLIPQAGTQAITLHFNAGQFAGGIYSANLGITNNDPSKPDVRIPVSMKLVDEIYIGPDTSFCGHLAITLDAGDGFASYLWSDGSTGQTDVIDSTIYGIGEATIWADVTDIGGIVKRDSILVNFLDCASIFELSGGLKVMIYPNPASTVINIEALEKISMVRIYNVFGECVSKTENPAAGIDVSRLVNGIYFVEVVTEKMNYKDKILVFR